MAGKINSVRDCFRFVSGSTNADFVVQFVHALKEQNVVPRLPLPDREFYAANVMSALDGLKMRFLMPAVRNAAIRKAILEYHSNMRDAVSTCTMRPGAACRLRLR